MRRSLLLLLAVAALVGGFWTWNNTQLFQYIQNGEILTFEARYTPEQILQGNSSEILGANHQREMRDAKLKFYPYLLLEVKYPTNKTSQEGVVYWSMVDGEMVISTESWDKTHGFADAINAGASPQDFKLMLALAKSKGPMSIDQLQKALRIDGDLLSNWIDHAVEKNLVMRHGKEVVLHFQNPKMPPTPQTETNESIVTKPYAEANRVGKTFSKSQIEKAAKAAFGDGFTIRTTREVYLPVYSIESVNPDGSIYTSFWNALNGQRVHNWQG